MTCIPQYKIKETIFIDGLRFDIASIGSGEYILFFEENTVVFFENYLALLKVSPYSPPTYTRGISDLKKIAEQIAKLNSGLKSRNPIHVAFCGNELKKRYGI